DAAAGRAEQPELHEEDEDRDPDGYSRHDERREEEPAQRAAKAYALPHQRERREEADRDRDERGGARDDERVRHAVAERRVAHDRQVPAEREAVRRDGGEVRAVE